MNSFIVKVYSKPLVKRFILNPSILLLILPDEFPVVRVQPRVIEGQPNLLDSLADQFDYSEGKHCRIGRNRNRSSNQRQQNFKRNVGCEMGAFSAVFGQGPHAGILQECSDDTPVWGLVGCIDSGRYGFKMFSINKLGHYLGSHVPPHALLTAAFPTQSNL